MCIFCSNYWPGMIRPLLIICFLTWAIGSSAQSFELIGLQDTYRGIIGETIKVPIRFKNNSDRPITLVIRKVSNQIGTTQKNFYCIDNNCLDHRTDDFVLKVEPNQVLSSLQVALEAGLAQGASSIKYLAFNKANPSDAFEFELNFLVEEKMEKEDIYASDRIMLHDVYPNPVTDHAFVDYNILDTHIKAKIMIHNILGNAIEEYPLPSSENKVKIRADALNSGIYFYTLYIDGEGVITQKLLVKK
jgi:hypothetical protein